MEVWVVYSYTLFCGAFACVVGSSPLWLSPCSTTEWTGKQQPAKCALAAENHTYTLIKSPQQRTIMLYQQTRTLWQHWHVEQTLVLSVFDVIQRVATGETAAYGTVDLDVYGTVGKQRTAK